MAEPDDHESRAAEVPVVPSYIPKAVVEELEWKEVVARWGTGWTWYQARVFCDVQTGEKQRCVYYRDEPSSFLNCPEKMLSDDFRWWFWLLEHRGAE